MKIEIITIMDYTNYGNKAILLTSHEAKTNYDGNYIAWKGR